MKLALISITLSCIIFNQSLVAVDELKLSQTMPPLERTDIAVRELGWEIGLQVWTLGAYKSLDKRLEIAKTLDLDYVEYGEFVQLTEESDKVSILKMTEVEKHTLRELLDKAGIPGKQLYVHSPRGETKWRQFFEYAKEMGIDTLIAEPFYEDFELVDQLTREYPIRVAIHNHPNEKNRYWNPDLVLKQIKHTNPNIGFCPDLGHWMRMGIDPIKTLSRKEVQQRLLAFHLNDVQELGEPKSPHVSIGTGAGQTMEMFQILKDSGYTGRFTLEYGNWNNNYLQLRDCITFFDMQAATLK